MKIKLFVIGYLLLSPISASPDNSLFDLFYQIFENFSEVKRLSLMLIHNKDDHVLRETSNKKNALQEKTRDLLNNILGRLEGHRVGEIALKEKIIEAQERRTENIEKQKLSLGLFEKQLENPKNLAMIASIIVATIASAHLAKKIISIASKQIELKLGYPTLIRESSRKGLFTKNKTKKAPATDLFLEVSLREKLEKLAWQTRMARENNEMFIHTLFFGPHGSGKSDAAKELAIFSGLEFAAVSGADFSQFKEGEDILELHKLLDWAESTKSGMVIFVDEVDSCFPNRAKSTERYKNFTNAFISRVSKSTAEKFMFIFATSHPDVLDPAIRSRIGKSIKFELPQFEERVKIFNQYLSQYAERYKVELAEELIRNVILLANKTDGFSAHQIEQCALEAVCQAKYFQRRKNNHPTLTLQIASEVIQNKVDEAILSSLQVGR